MSSWPDAPPSEWQHITGEMLAGMLPANSRSNVYESFRPVKSGVGVLIGISVYNSGPAQFIQLFDAQQLPADGAVPEMPYPITAGGYLLLNWIPGRTFRAGIVLCNSTTAPTKTIGAANCFFDAQYV